MAAVKSRATEECPTNAPPMTKEIRITNTEGRRKTRIARSSFVIRHLGICHSFVIGGALVGHWWSIPGCPFPRPAVSSPPFRFRRLTDAPSPWSAVRYPDRGVPGRRPARLPRVRPPYVSQLPHRPHRGALPQRPAL